MVTSDQDLALYIKQKDAWENKHGLSSSSNQAYFLLLGISLLLPWNALLASMDFY